MRSRPLTIRQVAEDLGISYGSALELVTTRAIRALDLRTPGAKRAAWRVEPEDLEAFKEVRATRKKDLAEHAEHANDLGESIRTTRVRFRK